MQVVESPQNPAGAEYAGCRYVRARDAARRIEELAAELEHRDGG
jgi:hypothetical protein